jgi:hypothetical protein
MTRIRIYLRKLSFAMMAVGLIIPLFVYASHRVGSGPIDVVRWGILTGCFWLGVILWASNRSKL